MILNIFSINSHFTTVFIQGYLFAESGHVQGCEGGLFSGFEDDYVSTGQGGGQLQGKHTHGVVPL